MPVANHTPAALSYSEAQCCGFGGGGVRDGSDEGGHGFGVGSEVDTLRFPRWLMCVLSS